MKSHINIDAHKAYIDAHSMHVHSSKKQPPMHAHILKCTNIHMPLHTHTHTYMCTIHTPQDSRCRCWYKCLLLLLQKPPAEETFQVRSTPWADATARLISYLSDLQSQDQALFPHPPSQPLTQEKAAWLPALLGLLVKPLNSSFAPLLNIESDPPKDRAASAHILAPGHTGERAASFILS